MIEQSSIHAVPCDSRNKREQSHLSWRWGAKANLISRSIFCDGTFPSLNVPPYAN